MEMNWMKKIVAGFGAAILASCGLFGQTAPPPPAFEVAPVKPAVLWERPGISGGQEVVLRADVHLVEVSIVATDAKGARAEGLTAADFRVLTLVPVPPRPGIRRLYPTVKADETAAFRFPSVTPGSYKVYAWEDIESSAHWDVDFIRPFESRGEPIQVDEGGSGTVPLKRVSPAEMTDTLIKEGL
jgi:hypothetical protein